MPSVPHVNAYHNHEVVCEQGSYKKLNVKFKNIQEHFWGENTIFQEHFRRVMRTFYLQLAGYLVSLGPLLPCLPPSPFLSLPVPSTPPSPSSEGVKKIIDFLGSS